MNKNVQNLARAVDQHAGMLNAHQAFIDRESAKQMLQHEKDIISHTIDRSKLYNQAIMAGGYAGFFAFWGFMRASMQEALFAISGLLMATSLAIFISYTIWHSILANRMLLKRMKDIAGAGDDPLRYLEIRKNYDEELKEWHRSTFRFWNIILVLTILPAAISGAILFYSFAATLLEPVSWGSVWQAIASWFR